MVGHLACTTKTDFVLKSRKMVQKDGAAMGSSLSHIVANIFIESFEQETLELAKNKPRLWVRYVDDTFVIWQHGLDNWNLSKSI